MASAKKTKRKRCAPSKPIYLSRTYNIVFTMVGRPSGIAGYSKHSPEVTSISSSPLCSRSVGSQIPTAFSSGTPRK
ncbi:hypothetical protein NQ317_009595 [Molorchus minor]|uniref:Uncharacterized protein n=1 Tax=Molorchus minor TaxID=1323400 RepID=A0ABQ9JNK5_9CUCU|nr:hypothetical protein NQ317_009595 [Molorchus minor]